MPILKCHKTAFYSQLDEEMFFAGLRRISGVKDIKGEGFDLLFSVPLRVSGKSLRELLGLFFRYKIDMRQLSQFATEKNRAWFESSEAFWFSKVFKNK